MGFILQYGYVLCHRKVSDLYVRNRGIAQLQVLQSDTTIEDSLIGEKVYFGHKDSCTYLS